MKLSHILVASTILAQPGLALAQDGDGLGDIIVTAQKRAQSLQDVPASVDVVSSELLAKRQVVRIGDIANIAPSFEFARAPSDSPGVTFRGIGTQAGNVAFDNSIGMFVDGTFLGNVRLYGQTLFDVERIELIKGTQSTLLGKNTSLGALSIVNRRPGDTFGGKVEVGGEVQNGGYFGEAAFDLPASDMLSFRLAGRYSHIKGWVKNVTTGRDVPIDTDYGLRASALVGGGGPASFLLTYQYTSNQRWGTANQITDPGLSALGLGAGPPLGESEFDDRKASFSSDPRLKKGEDITRLRAHMVTGTGEFELGALTLTSITAGAWFKLKNNLDFDFDNKDANVLARSERYSQFSQELRIASPSGREHALEYMAGIYAFTSKWRMVQDNVWGIPDFPPGDAIEGQLFNGSYTNRFDQRTNAISAFAQVTYKFSDVFRVNVGGRYTHEKKKVHFGRTNRAPFTIWNTVASAPFPYQRLTPITDDLWSGSVSLQYDVAPSATLYASAARGGKAGGYGEFNSVPFDPDLGEGNPNRDARVGNERANSYELGIKATISRQLRVNAALFYTDVFGLQQLKFTGLFESSNDRARSKGIEGTIQWQPIDQLTFNLAGTYADAKELDSGFRLGQSPRFSGSAGINWESDVSDGLRLALGGTVKHRTSKYNQPDEGLRTGAYTTLALNARLSADAGWYVNVAGENVTNSKGADFGFVGPDPFVNTFETMAPLRSIKISVGYEF